VSSNAAFNLPIVCSGVGPSAAERTGDNKKIAASSKQGMKIMYVAILEWFIIMSD